MTTLDILLIADSILRIGWAVLVLCMIPSMIYMIGILYRTYRFMGIANSIATTVEYVFLYPIMLLQSVKSFFAKS
jgi:hypothetical protein